MADCTATSQLPGVRDLQLLLRLQSWAVLGEEGIFFNDKPQSVHGLKGVG